jgi:ethanolamine utilization protein EutQ
MENNDDLMLKAAVRKVLEDILCTGGVDNAADSAHGNCGNCGAADAAGFAAGIRHFDKSGIACVSLPKIKTEHFDPAPAGDYVQLKDVYTVGESPRLGLGVMEMNRCDFEWTLTYDEIDYVIEGRLEIKVDDKVVAGADAGETILIPKGSHIKFSAPGFVRFTYTVYPANWTELG